MSVGVRLYLDFVVFAFGACIGSFLNVCIHRVPRGESLIRPPSRCPQCEKPIRWSDNVPLVSWLVLRGKCRHCAPVRAIHIIPSKKQRLSFAGRQPRPRSAGNRGPISAHSSSETPIRSPKAASKRQP